jgi:hypothetical protein
MNLVTDLFSKSDLSIIIVKNGSILLKKKENEIKTLLEAINDFQDNLKNSTIGINLLEKASALLCVYTKVAGVYSHRSTKKALAVLIRAGIPGQTDEIIIKPEESNNQQDFLYEKRLSYIDSPEFAYEILKEKILK